MVFQAVAGVVDGADQGDVHLVEHVADLHRHELPVGLVPDLPGGVFVQQQVDAEVAAQLQVRPDVQRVTQGVGHRAGEGGELVVGVGVAGDEDFVDAVGPHGPPLVVVGGQPHIE